MDDRFEKIETKLSLSEDLLEALNDTVYRQQRQIEQLQREIAMLREQVRAAVPNEPRNLNDEIPPHY
ncbi:MAG: SlyX family protein [Burkholderiales bacterium]